MNIKLITNSDIKNLPTVTSPNIFDQDGYYNDKGIFSEKIFGPVKDYMCKCGRLKGKKYKGIRCKKCGVIVESSKMRRTTYAKIKLKEPVIHPMITFYLIRKNQYFRKNITLFKNINFISEVEEYLDKLYNMKYEDITSTYDRIIWKIMHTLPNKYHIYYIPVIPPDLRPLSKFTQKKDINQFYISILNDNIAYDRKFIETYSDAYRFSVTKTVYRLFELVAEKISKKTGLIRSSLMGKEVDFSARTVITVDPKLSVDTVSLPKVVILKLFEPQVINILSYKITPYKAYDIIEKYVIDKDLLTNDEISLIEDAIEEVANKFKVIINRQPTLHRGSMKAYNIAINDGKSMKINPLICKTFNADMDGDSVITNVTLTIKTKNGDVVDITSNIADIYNLKL